MSPGPSARPNIRRVCRRPHLAFYSALERGFADVGSNPFVDRFRRNGSRKLEGYIPQRRYWRQNIAVSTLGPPRDFRQGLGGGHEHAIANPRCLASYRAETDTGKDVRIVHLVGLERPAM